MHININKYCKKNTYGTFKQFWGQHECVDKLLLKSSKEAV